MNRTDPDSAAIARAFRQACITELEALKPGNVGVHAAGHGMRVEDFLHSAEHSAEFIARDEARVGTRVLRSVRATRQAVGCNTNLGILLLCAPLARAAEVGRDRCIDLRTALGEVLRELDREDAEQVFRAIRLAAPGGLGRSDRHDVHQPARVSLREAMAVAARRDRIAYQYPHDFHDVFAIGLPVLNRELERRGTLPGATTGVYLNFLASFPDSHIMRKHGTAIAARVQRGASERLATYNALDAPDHTEALTAVLLAFDEQLKTRDINPGTCADLTVATLFACQLQALLTQNSAVSPLRAALNTRRGARAEAETPSLVAQSTL